MASSFATTAEERCKQEVNVIGSNLDAHLKALRKQIVENYTAVVPRPLHYFIRRLEIAVFDAANQMSEAEQHWKVN